MCSASGGSPTRRNATYASTVVERLGGAPKKLPHVPSSRCCERIRAALRALGPAWRTPRNSRSSRSSASIVTFVSSSPFHQPSACCSERRWSRARPSASAALTARSCAEVVRVTDIPGRNVSDAAPGASAPGRICCCLPLAADHEHALAALDGSDLVLVDPHGVPALAAVDP